MVNELYKSISGPVTSHAGLKAIKSSVIKSRTTLDYNKAHLKKRGRWDPGHSNIVGIQDIVILPKPETPPFKAREGKADVKSTVPQINKMRRREKESKA